MTTTTLLLAVAILLACWAATCLQPVPADSWVAATRRGVVRRVHRRGLAWRLPFVERFERQLAVQHQLPIQVRATTRDGVAVLMLAEATVSLPRPAVGAAYADPWRPAELAAEEVIARFVSEWPAAELPRTAETAASPLRRQVEEALHEYDVRVTDLTLVEVDIALHGSR